MTESRSVARWTVVMLVVASLWYVGLVTLAVTTANPATLNGRQILSSNLVIVGTVTEQGEVVVTKSYLGLPPKGPIKLIRDVPLPSTELILPLIKDGDLYRITPAVGMPESKQRLVYPANANTQAQLESLVN